MQSYYAKERRSRQRESAVEAVEIAENRRGTIPVPPTGGTVESSPPCNGGVNGETKVPVPPVGGTIEIIAVSI